MARRTLPTTRRGTGAFGAMAGSNDAEEETTHICYDEIMNDTDPKPPTLDQVTEPVTTSPDADVEAWHDEETRKTIVEADAGDFATAEEVKVTVRKFVPHG